MKCPLFLESLNIGNLIVVNMFVLQKRRVPENGTEWFDVRAEISHMRPIQGQKLKLFKVLIYGPDADDDGDDAPTILQSARALDHSAQG